MEMLKLILGPSPQTSIGGIIGAVGLTLMGFGDGNHSLMLTGAILSAVGAAWAGRAARDGNKSTEEHKDKL